MTLLVYVLGPNQKIFEMYRAMGIRSNTETLFKYRHFFYGVDEFVRWRNNSESC